MRLEFRGTKSIWSPPVRQHAERCLRLAVGRFGHRLAQVTIRAVDLQSSAGGDDKLCQVVVLAPPNSKVTVEALARDFRGAAAAERASRAVARLMHLRKWSNGSGAARRSAA